VSEQEDRDAHSDLEEEWGCDDDCLQECTLQGDCNHPAQGSSSSTTAFDTTGVAEPRALVANSGTSLIGKRLRKKTNPINTRYKDIAILGTREEYLRRQSKVQSVQKHNKQEDAIAEHRANQMLYRNIGLTNQLVDRHEYGDDVVHDCSVIDNIHPTHDVKQVRESAIALYCNRCGGWYNGGAITSLREACPGKIDRSRAFQHRLLSLGVIPRKGVRIPEHARKKQRRQHR
jgi:hypothetical protein